MKSSPGFYRYARSSLSIKTPRISLLIFFHCLFSFHNYLPNYTFPLIRLPTSNLERPRMTSRRIVDPGGSDSSLFCAGCLGLDPCSLPGRPRADLSSLYFTARPGPGCHIITTCRVIADRSHGYNTLTLQKPVIKPRQLKPRE